MATRGAIGFSDQGGATLVRGAKSDTSLIMLRRMLAGEGSISRRAASPPANCAS